MTPDEQNEETAYCPSCKQIAVKVGNEITCDNCDASFRITKHTHKLQQARISERLQDHEQRLAALEPERAPAPAPAPTPAPAPEKGGKSPSDSPSYDPAEDD